MRLRLRRGSLGKQWHWHWRRWCIGRSGASNTWRGCRASHHMAARCFPCQRRTKGSGGSSAATLRTFLLRPQRRWICSVPAGKVPAPPVVHRHPPMARKTCSICRLPYLDTLCTHSRQWAGLLHPLDPVDHISILFGSVGQPPLCAAVSHLGS